MGQNTEKHKIKNYVAKKKKLKERINILNKLSEFKNETSTSDFLSPYLPPEKIFSNKRKKKPQQPNIISMYINQKALKTAMSIKNSDALIDGKENGHLNELSESSIDTDDISTDEELESSENGNKELIEKIAKTAKDIPESSEHELEISNVFKNPLKPIIVNRDPEIE
ncbi:MAG: hypothetical protein MHPSP_003258, partial [Paramarteilia canceri]